VFDRPALPWNWARTTPLRSREGGHAFAHLAGDVDGGIALINKALILTPNLAARFRGGFLRTLSGDPDAAINFLHVRCD
jgi:hypothetical protein